MKSTRTEDAAGAQKILKHKLEERFRTLQDAFRRVDVNHNGFVTASDFESVLRDFDVQLTDDCVSELIARYDVNRDGFVSFDEFCSVMDPAPRPGPTTKLSELEAAPRMEAPGPADRVEEMLRRILYQDTYSLYTISEAFLKMDKDRSGLISPKELAQIFARANVELTEDEMAAVLAHYDTNKDGRVNLAELGKLLQPGQFETHGARGLHRAPDRLNREPAGLPSGGGSIEDHVVLEPTPAPAPSGARHVRPSLGPL